MATAVHSDRMATPSRAANSSVAHVVLGHPYAAGAGGATNKDGFVPTQNMLRLHLWALAQLRTSSLAAVLVVLSTSSGQRELPGYSNVSAEAALLAPRPIHVLRCPNNTLGSYGMYLHAYLVRPGYDYYIMSEVDYVPVMPHYDTLLARMHDLAFGRGSSRRPGMLTLVLQGRPVEGWRHKQTLHPQGAQIMHAASLRHLIDHVYVARKWTQSTSALMVRLVKQAGTGRYSSNRYDHIQEGFGLLLSAAGVAMRDCSHSFRAPYWNHHQVLDWTSAPRDLPMARALFVPMQALTLRAVTRCCGATFGACKSRGATCVVRDWAAAEARDCCTDAHFPPAAQHDVQARHRNHTLHLAPTYAGLHLRVEPAAGAGESSDDARVAMVVAHEELHEDKYHDPTIAAGARGDAAASGVPHLEGSMNSSLRAIRRAPPRHLLTS